MQRSESSPAEHVAGSTDIVSEILLRLPPKPLLRFKSVSKHWLSLISTPKFCHLHSTLHHHHIPPSLLLSHHHPTPSPSPSPSPSSSSSSSSLSFIIIPLTATSDNNSSTTPSNSEARCLNLGFLNRPHVAVVRSCNGLLLCHAAPTYFVCNPTTNTSLPLTLPNNQLPNQTRVVYLAFDPSRSPHFRVVSIRVTISGLRNDIHGRCTCECHVYSSETGLWSKPACFTAPRSVITSSGVYCNGAIHWCVEGAVPLYLDVGTRCLESFPMPLHYAEWGGRSVEYFGESKGRLHMITGISGRDFVFDVFELEEDYSGWSHIHHVDLNFGRAEFPELSWGLGRFVLPFYIVCEGKEGSSMMFVLLIGGTIISYDPVYRTLRKLCDFKPGMTVVDAVAGYMSGQVFQYFESLSPVEAFSA